MRPADPSDRCGNRDDHSPHPGTLAARCQLPASDPPLPRLSLWTAVSGPQPSGVPPCPEQEGRGRSSPPLP